MKNEKKLAQYIQMFRKYMSDKKNRGFLEKYVLQTIYLNKNITAKEIINEVENIKPQTLSNVLKKLEEKKLIVRSINKSDCRIVNIDITEEGKKISKQCEKEFFNDLKKFLDYLGEEDTQKLFHILERIEKYAKEI